MSPRRVHLIGIGGIGLSAIARVLVARGEVVSGSDLQSSAITDDLASRGVKIFIGHRAENVGDVDLVLVTSAARDGNPEIVQAQRRGIRIVKRYDFFQELVAGKTTIAIAGTHGKTTTTGMIAMILIDAEFDPDAIIGGIIPELGSNARAGHGKYFVIEADEYDRAFLGLRPMIAVVTSIEMDHPDIFRDVDHMAKAFHEFMALVPRDGLIVGCGDLERVDQEMAKIEGVTIVRYGLEKTNDWRATDVRLNAAGGSDFVVWRKTTRVGEFGLKIPGKHNILNALAAFAVADHVGIDLNQAGRTLKSFRGATRRFEITGESRGVTIIDDYAHHPSEIRATLAAARARYPDRKIWAVFQPHTYSRTQALLDGFAKAFDDADYVIVTEIFAAREQDSRGTSGKQVVDRMNKPAARFVATLDECIKLLEKELRAGDVLITLGAGDVYRVANTVARRWQGA